MDLRDNLHLSNFSMVETMGAKTGLAALAILVAVAPALAQNVTSRALMAATEAKRNATFKMILDSTNDHCDAVVRTQYYASTGDSDDWEAKCRDGGHYTFNIYGDPNKQTMVLSCRAVAAIDRMMQQRAGTRNPPLSCRMK